MKYDFDTIIDRRGSDSTKWAAYAGRDVIPMWLADMDFRSPPPVIDALRKRTAHGIFGYANPPKALIETIVNMLEHDYDWRIEPEWLIFSSGIVAGLNVACRAVGESGDEVIVLTPIYPPFLTAPKQSDRTLVTVPMAEPGQRWEIDFDRLEAAVTDRTKLLALCSPHNPVGRAFDREELTALTDMCERHDLIICSDEIHCGFILDEDRKHIPTATLSESIARRTITYMAPSKTFNVPGLQCSFAVISDAKLRATIKRVMAGMVPAGNVMGYTAAIAAYRDSGEWHAAMLDYLRRNRELLETEIANMPHLKMTHVEATCLAWINTRGLDGVTDPKAFFEQAGVGLSSGTDFGLPDFVRLNFACPRGILTKALRRIRTAVAG